MLIRANPPGAPKPVSNYSQTVEIPAGGRTVHVSGQVGLDVAGNLADGFEAQARQAIANVLACIAHHRMAAKDLVKLTVYLTRAGDVGAWRKVRDAELPGDPVASTLLVISGLADPRLLVEVEAIAAVAPPPPPRGPMRADR